MSAQAADLPDVKLYTSAELFVAGALSTMPPFDKQHPAMCLPYARCALDALSEWDPDDFDGGVMNDPAPTPPEPKAETDG